VAWLLCLMPLGAGTVAPAEENATTAAHISGVAIGAKTVRELIQVRQDNQGFACQPSGRRFIPWGFNYDRDYQSRLLEDYWEGEWSTVVEDFREMKALGANVVRIHLQFARFMEKPDRPHKKSLERLGRLVKLAEQTGLYLDLTGLACYRKQDVPAWYSSMGETERWEAQARFWRAIAKRCARSPAIFCYDLMNEPIVPGGKRGAGDWLAGELGGFAYCQFISLDQAERPRPEIARQWVAQLVSAIRKEDQRHLITVGLLPNSLEGSPWPSGFVPQKVAGKLDFVCVHLYPKTDLLKEDLKTLQGFNVGKPVVIEETFPLSCSGPEMRQFLEASRTNAAGWIGFYWGQTPSELSKSSKLGDAITAEWLKLFQELKPN
jgi:hypothetical protein